MVVLLGDADVADAAVLAARGFEDVACPARLAGVKQYMVVGVVPELRGKVGGGDHGRGGADGFVGRPEGEGDGGDGGEAVGGAETGPGGGDKDELGGDDNGKVEYLRRVNGRRSVNVKRGLYTRTSGWFSFIR